MEWRCATPSTSRSLTVRLIWAAALDQVEKDCREGYDRFVVITDEQSHDHVPPPHGTGYMINVASNRNGVGYGEWMHIDGWSEAVVEFIAELESTDVRPE